MHLRKRETRCVGLGAHAFLNELSLGCTDFFTADRETNFPVRPSALLSPLSAPIGPYFRTRYAR